MYFVDDKGKARKQWYALLDLDKEKNAKDKDEDGDSAPPRTVAALATAPAARPALPPPTSSSPAPIPPAGSAQPVISRNVKCNFSSTPSGAEISIDGKYVGSTPSEISLSTGTHVVVFTNPGFNQWKRELTVLSDSELTVNAVLQKE